MSKLALRNRYSGATLSSENALLVMVRAYDITDEIVQELLQNLEPFSPCINEKDELDEKKLFELIVESSGIKNYEEFKEVQEVFNAYKKILTDFRVINKGDV